MAPSTRSRSKSAEEEEEEFQAIEDILTIHDLYASEDIKIAEKAKYEVDETLNKRVSIWRGKLSKSPQSWSELMCCRRYYYSEGTSQLYDDWHEMRYEDADKIRQG
jgi:hypothetical protein